MLPDTAHINVKCEAGRKSLSTDIEKYRKNLIKAIDLALTVAKHVTDEGNRMSILLSLFFWEGPSNSSSQ